VRFRDSAPLPEGMTGHPDGVEWYCERHFDAAEALSEASYADALHELRRVYGFKGWAPAWRASLRKRYWFPR
jgi:hypothetical protein